MGAQAMLAAEDTVDIVLQIIVSGLAAGGAYCLITLGFVLIYKAAMAKGIDVFSSYGLSETCSIPTLAYLKLHMAEREDELPFRPSDPAGGFKGYRCEWARSTVRRHECRRGCGQGSMAYAGLLPGNGRSEEIWEGGFLHTADVGFLDGEGYLQITYRINDVIKTGGK